jgi:hypothetical protein
MHPSSSRRASSSRSRSGDMTIPSSVRVTSPSRAIRTTRRNRKRTNVTQPARSAIFLSAYVRARKNAEAMTASSAYKEVDGERQAREREPVFDPVPVVPHEEPRCGLNPVRHHHAGDLKVMAQVVVTGEKPARPFIVQDRRGNRAALVARVTEIVEELGTLKAAFQYRPVRLTRLGEFPLLVELVRLAQLLLRGLGGELPRGNESQKQEKYRARCHLSIRSSATMMRCASS